VTTVSDTRPAFPNNFTVVLIDHHGARFFEPADGSRLEERAHLEPEDPHGFHRHLEHRKEAHYKGERVPEADEFYERVSERLKNSSSILLIGDATGTSSALVYFRGYLQDKHKEIDEHVIGVERADLSHMALGEIEQIARKYT
jgi:hypothetical protein